MPALYALFFFFFFNDTATTEIYTLSLHDALPIYRFETDFALRLAAAGGKTWFEPHASLRHLKLATGDRKSTRLNSSHSQISYAVFCLKKKNKVRHALATLSSLVSQHESSHRRA